LAERGWAPVLLVFSDETDVDAGAAMRADFVANVSHELKTPLTAAIGFIETVLGPAKDDTKARERFLTLMGQELTRMSRLVSDLLSLSRLEGQSRRRPREALDIVPLLYESTELLGAVAEDAGVNLVVETVPTARALADRDQILQVLTNLVENGIKYGARPGDVRITLSEIAHEPVIRGAAWQLSVADDGIGVPPEHIPRLTERFYRVDPGRSRDEGGTGLGLSIVKHIVNRHRGRMRIESFPGKGTKVTIALPKAD
jgi:two-component system phosphate regulon sensor histidine kinase PhoR